LARLVLIWRSTMVLWLARRLVMFIFIWFLVLKTMAANFGSANHIPPVKRRL